MSLILDGTNGLSDIDGSAATPAIRGTDANTGIFFPAADTIAFSEGGVEAVRIDGDGDVGIGTTTPGKKLDILSNTSQDGIRISGSTNPRLTIIDTTTPVQFDALCTDTEVVLRADTNHPLVLSTNGTERMRIPAAGGVQAVTTISVGNATPSASGAGITFPATQSASSNANTLDDYEEGTWTPAIGGNATYYAQEGYYTKIGNIVYFYGKIIINVKGTGNNFTMTGFPFNAIYNIRLDVQYWTLLATNVVFLGAVGSGNTQVDFHSTTAAASNVATNTVFGNGTTISFNGFYSV